MNRFEIEHLYENNGLKDYRINTLEDLRTVHGIDYEDVNGYAGLDDLNRNIYKKFIINIFNAFGLESRATLIPRAIYFVEEVQYLAKENPEDDYYIVVSGDIKSVDRNGLRTLIHSWKDEDYKDLKMTDCEIKNYLRFEYEHQGRKEWLHVIKEGQEWY